MNQAEAKKPHVSVAPMMDWTDRHCRYFLRQISPNTRLYTEMVTTGALIHGDRDRFLRYDACEHPLALQLGGSNPAELAECAKMAEDWGYDEVNLNCGFPSDRVQKGRFGACLMKEPEHVAACIEAMSAATSLPVTIKCRVGVDTYDDLDFLCGFVEKTADAGCKTFVIHARKAWLKGLSPKENREVPPIDYERVAAVKKSFPQLCIILNGEIKTIAQTDKNLETFDGVMIGREAYQNPWILSGIEREIFKTPAEQLASREETALAMIKYAETQAEKYQTPVKSITRHMIGLFHEQPGARRWRQALSTLPHEDGASPSIIRDALKSMEFCDQGLFA